MYYVAEQYAPSSTPLALLTAPPAVVCCRDIRTGLIDIDPLRRLDLRGWCRSGGMFFHASEYTAEDALGQFGDGVDDRYGIDDKSGTLGDLRRSVDDDLRQRARIALLATQPAGINLVGAQVGAIDAPPLDQAIYSFPV